MKKIVVVAEGPKPDDHLVNLLASFFTDCELQSLSRQEPRASSSQDEEETR